MSEFTASANLEVTPVGIDSAKREIERELGDLEVGVSANRPTGSGGRRGGIGPSGSEAADIELARRQLGQQESLVELAVARNDILQELLEEDGGGGGGGILRTAGRLSLTLGAASVLGSAVANPFTALTAATLAGGAAAAATTTEEQRRRGNVPAGPGPGPDSTGPPDGQDPPPGVQNAITALENQVDGGIFTTEPPSGPPRAGGLKQEDNINIDPNINVDGGIFTTEPPSGPPRAGGLKQENNINIDPNINVEQRREFAGADFATPQEVEQTIKTELKRFEQRLRQQLGSGSDPRMLPGERRAVNSLGNIR